MWWAEEKRFEIEKQKKEYRYQKIIIISNSILERKKKYKKQEAVWTGPFCANSTVRRNSSTPHFRANAGTLRAKQRYLEH